MQSERTLLSQQRETGDTSSKPIKKFTNTEDLDGNINDFKLTYFYVTPRWTHFPRLFHLKVHQNSFSQQEKNTSIHFCDFVQHRCFSWKFRACAEAKRIKTNRNCWKSSILKMCPQKKPIEKFRHPDQNQLFDEKTSLDVWVVQNWKKAQLWKFWKYQKLSKNPQKLGSQDSFPQTNQNYVWFQLEVSKKYKTNLIVKVLWNWINLNRYISKHTTYKKRIFVKLVETNWVFEILSQRKAIKDNLSRQVKSNYDKNQSLW